MKVGDRYTIPQWQHTNHSGFVEVVDIGSTLRRNGKVRLLFPDLTSPWVSKREFEKQNYKLIRKGEDKVNLRKEIDDFWVRGEQETVYTLTLSEIKSRGFTLPPKSVMSGKYRELK